jgi:hypothetical protein
VKKTVENTARANLLRAAEAEADDVARAYVKGGGNPNAFGVVRRHALVDAAPNARRMEMAKLDVASHDPVVRRVYVQAMAVDGAAGGAVGNGAGTALDDRTWKDGVVNGLQQVGTSAAIGAAGGGVLGAGAGKLMPKGAAGKIDDAKVWQVDGDTRYFGDWNDMRIAARADGASSPVVKLTAGGQSFDLKIHGARSAAEVAQVQAAAQRLADVIGPVRASQALKEINLREVLGGSVGGQNGIGGLARPTTLQGDMMLARSNLSDPQKLQYVLFHEAGHNVDGLAGAVSQMDAAPFGKGTGFISDYARTDPWEDFAETFAHVTQNYDQVKANLPRLDLAPGGVGEKIKFMFDFVEHQRNLR